MQSACTPIVSLTRSPSGTFEASPPIPSTEETGSSLGVSPARIFPSLVKALGWRVQDPASGTNTPALLASYDPNSQSWRTSELSLFGDSILYSGALPRSGTMRNGRIYAPPMSERPTEGKGSGLWATPAAADSVGSHGGGQGRSLRTDIYNWKRGLWPTPRANDAEKRGDFDETNPRNGLPAAVKCWPTPKARDWKAQGGAHRHSPDLAGAAGGQLNPQFVEWLMNYPKGWTDLTISKPHYIIGYYGKTTDSLSEKELCVLREGIDSQELQGDAGRSHGIHAPEILQPGVHGEGDDSGGREHSRAQEAVSQAPRQNLRELRSKNEPRYSSSGLEPGEQFTRKSDDLVQFLSCEMALDSWEKEIKAPDCLQNMRRACAEIGYVPETLSEIQEIWRSATDEEKNWLKIRISTRNPWHSEWPGVPRVAQSIPSRVDRLKCLGNSIVPQIAELIFAQSAFDEWRASA